MPLLSFQADHVGDPLGVLIPLQASPLHAGDLGNRERTVIAVLLRNTA